MTTDCGSTEPTDAEMTAALKALAQWQTPDAFVSKVNSIDSLVKSSILFNKTNVGFLRDALPIAKLARYRNWHAVRLAEQHERLNDGQFRDSNGHVACIEVTEVMEPGRRRGDEYRCGAAKMKDLDFDPNLGNFIARELASGIKRKVEKQYPTRPLLLVYLNIGTGGRLGNEVEKAIEAMKTRYTGDFHEICVLWGTKLY